MATGSSLRRGILLAGAFGSMLVAGAAAQQSPNTGGPPPAAAPAAQPALPPGSPLIGRPETNAAAAKLAPVAPPPIPTAEDKLPTAKLRPPSGFNIEVYAAGLANARTMRQGDKGTIFVSTRLQDKIYAIVDKNGKRDVKVVAKGLYRPNGIVLYNGTLYIAELSQISKIENVEDNLDNPQKPTVIFSDLPKDEAHGWKFLTLGPDNKLYFQVGAPCNICMPDERHGKIYRLNLDGTGLEVYARGIRQIVGMDWHPTLKQLYFTENSRDWLSEDIPEDKFNRVTLPGKDNFGYPYCHQGNIPDQEFGWGHSCDEFTKPIALLGPHAAALGMRFYTGNLFPSSYKGAVFIARHGSWNRTKKFGGDVVVARLNKDGTVKSIEPFLTGFIENNSYIGRPADVLPLSDGSLLVSDDFNGAVYRVTYGKPQVAGR
jgi:glucose/arabinose dehydrogenase